MRHTTYCKMLLFVFLLFICKFEYCDSNNGGCFEEEWVALLKFKKSLIDQSNRLSSWKGLNCCEWEGVSCSPRTNHVSKLDLRNTVSFEVENWSSYSNSCLGGQINPSLINLTHLYYFDLSLNNFSGIRIPKFLGSFKHLRYLNLSSSGFEGNIPTHLGNLSSLEHLHLGAVTIGVPYPNYLSTNNLDWLTRLSSLKSLDMSQTFIEHSENWLWSINKLVSLSSLNLVHCNLKLTDPLLHVNSTTLISLNLEWNSLDSTILLWLSNLTKLEHLSIAFNNFQSAINSSSLIPFCKLCNLVSIDLSENYFQGLIPRCFGNLTSLTFLSLAHNSFTGSIPNGISGLYSLQKLYLNNNNFVGQLPNQLYKCKNLKYLVLSSNSFTGPIANSLGKLSMLKYVHIDSNKFSGSIPSSLGELSNLEDLDISNNSFTGLLSESHFSKLSKLRYLFISGNLLGLNVSSNWVPPFQLEDIYMNFFKIGPHFPRWLHTQRNVKSLVMSSASISDVIPDWFWNLLCNTSRLDLSKNCLGGELPMKLHVESCMKASMLYLSLSNNLLTGKIPKWLCSLKDLMVLTLSANKLSGEIPPCLGELQSLNVLNLANNNLYGHIPNSLGSLQQLQSLHLHNNKLDGKLPGLHNLSRLTILDLSENELMDVLPSWIGENLSSMKILVLHTNKFYGDIPLKLCQLQDLQLLNLASNNISGSIPRCFNNLTGMISEGNSTLLGYLWAEGKEYEYEIIANIKGLTLQYTKTLPFLRSIDLSGNHFIGIIPVELTSLCVLQNLNLFGNHLSGTIPYTIGNLGKIESLDLSKNVLSGSIPPSLSSLTFLSYLNLSFNNLCGKIPSGSQLQTLIDPSIYMGNEGLCGVPLSKSCPSDKSPSVDQHTNTNSDGTEFFMWFYAGMGPGFFVGFIGMLSILLFKRSWCYAYFKFLGMTYNKILCYIFIKG